MSSWANRNVLRKRDISMIPSELRPHIVSRIEQPQVILSETFQHRIAEDLINEVIYPSKEYGMDRQYYVTRKLEVVSSSAKELRYKNKSYVFVILRSINTTKDNDLWIASYNSIRKFYTNKIVIIDDNSSINTVNGKLVNTEIIISTHNGAGEVLPYYYFLEHKWADRMIFLHDSMFLHRRFKDSELDDSLVFHWEFDKTHVKKYDKLIGTYISVLKNPSELTTYFQNTDNVWKGCFGATSIIDLQTVEFLEEKYGFFSLLVLSIRSRKEREIFERIFGLVVFFENLVNTEHCANFGNIMKYPRAFELTNANLDSISSLLTEYNYDSAIVKVWRGR